MSGHDDQTPGRPSEVAPSFGRPVPLESADELTDAERAPAKSGMRLQTVIIPGALILAIVLIVLIVIL